VETIARKAVFKHWQSIISLPCEQARHDEDSALDLAKDLLGFGLFLLRLKDMILAHQNSPTAQSLAAQHCEDILQYIFAGKVQANPLNTDQVVHSARAPSEVSLPANDTDPKPAGGHIAACCVIS
jgi:hypothetical protein